MADPMVLTPIGRVESTLLDPASAPKQGDEGAPDAWIVLEPEFRAGLADIGTGDRVIVLTWLDRARRDVLRVHPRDDPATPMRGVFSTRSADRPNPIGLHEADVTAVDDLRVRVGALEAVDGTPVVDLKPVLGPSRGSEPRSAPGRGSVATRLPAQDLGRARRFYAEKLGLEPAEERPGGLRYLVGRGEFALFESAGAPAGDHTQMAWEVEDLDSTLAELRDRGLELEEYDVPGLRTVEGVAEVAGNYPSKGGVGERAAWFRDSEGNLIGIGQAIRPGDRT